MRYLPYLLFFIAGGMVFSLMSDRFISETASAPGTDPKIDYKNEDALQSAIKESGIKKVMSRLVEESGGGSLWDCHQQAHQIGRIGYRVEKEKAFQSCDASCHSGCYHGAMESLLNEKGTIDLASNIDKVCSLFETNFGTFECLHGVGHGVLAYLDYDLPEALKECGKLKDSFGQTSCYGGLFMENILTGQGLGASNKPDHETKWVNQDDPYFPCDKVDPSYAVQYQCYQMQTSWILTLSKYDFDKVVSQCLMAPADMIPVCFKSLGRDIAGHTLRNPREIAELCKKVPENNGYHDRCVEGAVNVIIDFWGPALKAQATELCMALEGPGKKICYTVLGGRLDGIFKNAGDRKKICSGFEAVYQNLCD